MTLATATQIAKATGLSKVRVNQLLNAGRFVGAHKIGGFWLIPVDEDGHPERVPAKQDEGNE